MSRLGGREGLALCVSLAQSPSTEAVHRFSTTAGKAVLENTGTARSDRL